jgi:hypothetical protein
MNLSFFFLSFFLIVSSDSDNSANSLGTYATDILYEVSLGITGLANPIHNRMLDKEYPDKLTLATEEDIVLEVPEKKNKFRGPKRFGDRC